MRCASSRHIEGRGDGRAARQDVSEGKARDLIIVAALLAVITLMHYYTDIGATALHILYRRLYYIPIIYAAFRFGLRGGVATSIAATLLFAPHIVFGLGMEGGALDNWFEIILFNVVGVITGGLVEAEQRQMANYQRVSSQLETAYAKLEERALALSSLQNFTRSILESTTSGVLSVDQNMRIVACNRAAADIFGMDEDELVGSKLSELCKGETDLCRQAQQVLSGERERVDTELKLTNARGRVVPATVSIAPHKDLAGDKIGVVVTLEDLTEVRELYEQLLRADRLAAMGELVAGVAHEVRNPLGTIRASIQLLEGENPDVPSVAELAPVVKQEIDRLDGVIKALLDFGRPSKPVFADVDLPKVIEDVVTFTRRYARRAHVSVATKAADGRAHVWADAEQLKQVFINLIFNAVQAMPDGGQVTIETADADGFVKVTVRDTGTGMPSDVLGKIWDPFFTTRDEGSGLGLAVVHRIVDEHGGYIGVVSEVGNGTTFVVKLPAKARERSVAVAVPPASGRRGARKKRQRSASDPGSQEA